MSPKETFFVNGIEFVVIDDGIIQYTPANQKEIVIKQVAKLAIAKYPITNRQFNEFLENNTDYKIQRMNDPKFLRDYRKLDVIHKKKMENAAVYFVDWNDANRYCEYLSSFLSDGTIERFRLPTETEWYYVASCGMAEKYQTPTDIVYMNKRGPLNTVAINNTLYENEFGVVGMLGNINEWTSSKATIVKAKKFENSNEISHSRRIIKGGSFASKLPMITVKYATDVEEGNMHYIGFRPVITFSEAFLSLQNNCLIGEVPVNDYTALQEEKRTSEKLEKINYSKEVVSDDDLDDFFGNMI